MQKKKNDAPSHAFMNSFLSFYFCANHSLDQCGLDYRLLIDAISLPQNIAKQG